MPYLSDFLPRSAFWIRTSSFHPLDLMMECQAWHRWTRFCLFEAAGGFEHVSCSDISNMASWVFSPINGRLNGENQRTTGTTIYIAIEQFGMEHICTCCLPNYLLTWVIFHGELLNYRSTLILFEWMTTWCLDLLAMIINRTCCDAVQFQPESLLLIQAHFSWWILILACEPPFCGWRQWNRSSRLLFGEVSSSQTGRTPFVNKNYFLVKTMYEHPVWTR
jgi:hypothetical protein